MGSRSLGFGSRRDDQKMFYKVRNYWVPPSGFSVVHRLYEDEDPFDDIKTQEELHELLDRISPSNTNCPVEEYINGEGDGPTCMQYNNNWEDHFFANLGSSQTFSDSLVQEDPDDEGQFDLYRTTSTKNHTVSRCNILTRGGSVIPGLERIF